MSNKKLTFTLDIEKDNDLRRAIKQMCDDQFKTVARETAAKMFYEELKKKLENITIDSIEEKLDTIVTRMLWRSIRNEQIEVLENSYKFEIPDYGFMLDKYMNTYFERTLEKVIQMSLSEIIDKKVKDVVKGFLL